MHRLLIALVLLFSLSSHAQPGGPISAMETYIGPVDSFFFPSAYKAGNTWYNRKIAGETLSGLIGKGGGSIPMWGSYSFDFTGSDSASLFDVTTANITLSKTASGLRIQSSDTSVAFHSNRLLYKTAGQTWLNRWRQQLTIIPNSATGVRKVGVAITGTGDLALASALGQSFTSFGFLLQLTNSRNTSGILLDQSAAYYGSNNSYKRFTGGLRWAVGDSIRLTVDQIENNVFKVIAQNLSNGSTVSVYANRPLPNDGANQNRSTEPGYFSIVTNGGDITLKEYAIDLKADRITSTVVIGNSITYGYGLGTYGVNNHGQTWYNRIKDSLPFWTMLMAKGGTTSSDAVKLLPQIMAVAPKYVILDGLQTNDAFQYGFSNVAQSNAAYANLVTRLKAYGFTVIHIVPAPRGTNDGLYNNFQRDARDYMLANYSNDLIIDDWTTLLKAGTTNTLDNAYYSEGDGTHLNTAGQAVRAAAVLAALKNTAPPTPWIVNNPPGRQRGLAHVDSVRAVAVRSDSTVSQLGVFGQANTQGYTSVKLGVKGHFRFDMPVGTMYSVADDNYLNYSVNSTQFIRQYHQNSNAGNGAGIGFLLANNAGTFLQIYKGSVTNGFTAGGSMLWENGGDLRLTSSVADITFSHSPFAGSLERMRLKFASGNLLLNTTSDNGTDKLQVNGSAAVSALKITGAVAEYADNAAAIAAGLLTGAIYRTGDVLKIVH